MKTQGGLSMLAGIGVIVGAGISAVDNFAFGGEVSPIVIVGMLLVFSAAAGTIWGTRATVASAIVWAWLPIAHLLKHVMGLVDTLPSLLLRLLSVATGVLLLLCGAVFEADHKLQP